MAKAQLPKECFAGPGTGSLVLARKLRSILNPAPFEPSVFFR